MVGDRPRMEWKDLMFNNGSRPKAKFTLWLQLQNRLPTTDRLQKWGLDVDLKCKLCNVYLETRDHIYVQCDYSRAIWMKLLRWVHTDYYAAANWGNHLQWIRSKTKGKSQAAQTLKLVYTEFIYAVWMERNQRTFEDKRRSWQAVAREIAYVCCVRAPASIRTRMQQLVY
ncbi:uncharacterized protein LOC132054210 [Lycium ferocissimum]|uniref:uncharacterized protein LOC132054210 n=1 Tax=Lycium ferocissimum TaxID=112874 RepID=UPI002815C59B|nr:uncharacterized protein LOC132054210 [Lycium ferocissimum]